DPERKLFAVGFRVEEGKFDSSYFDLLASEARLTSFIAVGRGDVEASHWYRLARPLAPIGRGSMLLSWSGSMFEYLMPSLILEEPSGGLLDRTNRLAVGQQIRFARRRGVPWGISEAAYNARDRQLNYQYGPFGVPELGLRREDEKELVVAPYATALAAMLVPGAARANCERLEGLGARGRFGFYESIDFTPARLPEGERLALVRCFMAHHQAMTVLAIAQLATGGALRRHFHSHLQVRAAELLLQERTPRDVLAVRPPPSIRSRPRERRTPAAALRRYESAVAAAPRTQLLSNGRWTTMVSQAGAGYSRCDGLAITRFRPDPTTEDSGSWIYLRDASSGAVWSAGFQPTAARPDSYEAIFTEAKAEIRRHDLGPNGVASLLEVVVTPEDDAELRRLTLTNLGARPRTLEVTTYAEVVVAPPAADEAHPAFSNLFVETALGRTPGSLLARRRPRSAHEAERWLAQVLAVERPDALAGPIQVETDRMRFLGRGRRPRDPISVLGGRPLSGTVGHVLDPVFSLRAIVRLPPRSSSRLVLTTLVAGSRDQAEALAEKYGAAGIFQRATTLAWTAAEVELRHLGLSHEEANLYQRLAARLQFPEGALRSRAAARRNRLGQSALWGLGVSGDLPLFLVRIEAEEDRELVRQSLRAHHYLRLRGLPVDLVIVNEHGANYAQELQRTLESMARASAAVDGPGSGASGVFVLRAAELADETRDLLRAAARVVLVGRQGGMAEQLDVLHRAEDRTVVGSMTAPPPRPRRPPIRASEPAALAPPPPLEGLEFWNGVGGLDGGGREYVVRLEPGRSTPQPWINVVVDPEAEFGFQVSEAGAGFTWSGNSREYRLTPWSNDPVSDPPGEAFYVRDEDDGTITSPCLAVAPAAMTAAAPAYVTRHGRGYSRFEHTENGLALELVQLVPLGAAVKVSHLTIRNRSARPRRLAVCAYAEWVLGATRSASTPHVVTEHDPVLGALLARNPWQSEFGARLAFAHLDGADLEPAGSYTCDRREFLGRHGTVASPAALEAGQPLRGSTGGCLDPCAALLRRLVLAPGATAEVTFLLGCSADGAMERVRAVIARYGRPQIGALLAALERRWDDIGGALEVRTPDRALDVMVNHWLLRQTLACRFWARSAFYQSSGAYGFRDQLQDVMAATVPLRQQVRDHLLRTAARQFREGDVQHWWHLPSGRGVRTRCSDDLLWLPLAVAHYVEVTDDRAVLEEPVPFLEQPALRPEQEDDYRTPAISSERASVFEHCARAVDYALERRGAHGLPLMGSGDWNDGMNRVGIEGRGESVWLGWFLCTVLERMAALAAPRGGED
ncbi:MAG TPA: glucoamylase family protein, partial [Kofleriaceae bacterium]